ncbi:malonate decarboxylase acyl carrier protein [Undibacterium sp. Jales W-56]|uniref:malonate decarboxylase acyl carrier protein n=1 Tax=Undibacterium sp. Jales W-56 TaxID=2897325 RepID=UPI0021CF3059|nr:malonate decarboxylase acyl carrier protein [Undibacterium sp. Jales W-56]MCU6434496.1 malonate decarboxylase acyl carrier protein [Undibacterium sp. Jales W-56]
MEQLTYRFEHGSRQVPPQAELVGVVSSGNLEVLIEWCQLANACVIEINTAATGFGMIWAAVMKDFNARWLLADVKITINDMGATPAVVSLRLDQAVETILGHTNGVPS